MPGHFINHIFTAVVEQEVLENLPPPLAKRLVEELYRTQVRKSQVGPTSAFYSSCCIPTGMHGPTHTFWANLTPFTLQVKQVPMFNGMQEEIVVRICYVLRPLNCMGGDFIFKENELGQEMYLIEKGLVEPATDANIILTPPPCVFH